MIEIDLRPVIAGFDHRSLECILFKNCDCCPHAGLRWHAAALGHPDAALDVTHALATERAAKSSNDEVCRCKQSVPRRRQTRLLVG